ncbi:hypothetical protein C8R47DRAFT_1218812 [Mycena vitilis]|nr:hypothetical protein C8R47DRAFT_1218812 [Mycena vitilis]
MSPKLAPTAVSGNEILKHRMPPSSIIEVLGRDYHRISASAPSTADLDPPITYVAIRSHELGALMENKVMKQILEEKTFVELETEKSHRLATEADVERVTHLYLIHETNKIMEAYVKAEFPGKRLRCLSQVTADRSRTDLLWKIGRITIFVLEMKRCNVVRKDDWTKHVIKVPEDITDTAEKMQFVQAEAAEQMKKSWNFRDKTNRIPLSQQAVKYHENKAPVVLLFDWLEMIMLDFCPNGQEYNDETNPVGFFHSADGRGNINSKAEREWVYRRLLIAAFLAGLKSVQSDVEEEDDA